MVKCHKKTKRRLKGKEETNQKQGSSKEYDECELIFLS